MTFVTWLTAGIATKSAPWCIRARERTPRRSPKAPPPRVYPGMGGGPRCQPPARGDQADSLSAGRRLLSIVAIDTWLGMVGRVSSRCRTTTPALPIQPAAGAASGRGAAGLGRVPGGSFFSTWHPAGRGAVSLPGSCRRARHPCFHSWAFRARPGRLICVPLVQFSYGNDVYPDRHFQKSLFL
jgi:hypothetical protein